MCLPSALSDASIWSSTCLEASASSEFDQLERRRRPRVRIRGEQRSTALDLQRELRLLALEPYPQRIGPADIRAAVMVVADPGGERHETRHERRPLARIELARDIEHDLVQLADGIDRMADRIHRAREFIGERDAGRPVAEIARLLDDGVHLASAERTPAVIRARGKLGQKATERVRHGERRMRREDDPVVEAFDQGERNSAKGSRLAIAAREAEDQFAQPRLVGGDAGLSNISADALGALDEALQRHVLDEFSERSPTRARCGRQGGSARAPCAGSDCRTGRPRRLRGSRPSERATAGAGRWDRAPARAEMRPPRRGSRPLGCGQGL